MRVTLVGSGNVATVLGRKLVQSGHIIHQVISQNFDHAKHLANELSAEAVKEADDNSDICIVAVSDDALQNISSWMGPRRQFVIHTAGSISMDVLNGVSDNYGVLWPLQSLRKENATIPALPLIIDANNQWNKMKLTGFAQSFGDSVTVANDEERRKLHLCAVSTNNFSNYLFSLTEEYCLKEGVDFKLLLPLLHETVDRLHFHSAADLQTGPAIRKDESTIGKHRSLLSNDRSLLEVYDFFTERIMQRS
jgi:hypothetical protein